MDPLLSILMPLMLPLSRVSGFFVVLPIFGSQAVPARVRIGLVLAVTMFLAFTVQSPPLGAISTIEAGLLVAREVLIGLALGLAIRLLLLAVQQAAIIVEQQMGLTMAEIIDPTTGEQSQPLGVFFDMAFMLLLLTAGVHRLMLRVVAASYQLLPVGGQLDTAALAEGVLDAGSTMLLVALQLSAPVLAAFLVLSVVLGILALVLPEMNILMASLPLRVGLGLLMAAAMVPLLNSAQLQLVQWLDRLL